jgi:hypothetical protein
MKVTTKFLVGVLVIMFSFTGIQAQTYISEGFEGTSSLHVPPTNWIPDSQSDFWYFQNGGWDQFTGYHHPANAHTGSYNAMFKTFGTATSKLVSPSVDLRFSIKPVLTFWNAQEERAFINDKLKIYYRTSPTSAWVLLDSYINPTAGWTKREIILPDAAKTQTCQLGFEGSSQNISWGVCIDDIMLEEKGNLARQVESVSLTQNNYFIPSNSNTNPIGIIGIKISGNTGNQTLNSISAEYTGTNISDININSSELIFTRDTIFSTKIKLTPTISYTGNTITFSNLNYNLQTGDNFIWICASVKSTATYGNTADFKLLQNSININGNLFPGGIIDPSALSTIEESIFFDGFESLLGWQFSPGSCWQIGVPTGLGTNDPDFTFSGTKVLATNLSGNYPAGIRPLNPHTATTPSINAKFYQNINLRFKRWLNFEYFDKTYIQCSIDGGATWTNIWGNNTTIGDQNWKSIGYNLSQLATRKQNVKIRFSIDSSDISGLYGGWNIDNFAVTGDFIAKDLGVSGITAPVSHCGMSAAETVTVLIKNYGGAAVSGPFDVGFSLDNGVTYTKESVSQTINSEQEITYTFTAKANLSQPGLKQLKFKTFLVGDEDLTNDSYSATLFVYPTVNYVYLNSFESSNGYWNPGGTNGNWVWGIVAKTNINKAFDGTKVWVNGGLKSTYGSPEQSYLESPCIDFTLAEYPVISFNYWINSELGVDGFRLDYSIDGGNTWSPVTANSNHNLNWCTGATVSALGTDGWSGSTSTAYQLARTLLPANVTGKNNVKFRFIFASDANNSMEGVAIDAIKIYELPYDVGIKRLVSPISGCYIGNNVKLTAKVKNYGYRPLKNGLKVPIEIKLRSENVVKDTLIISSLVAQNDSASFTSTGSYNIYTKGIHALRLNTNFTPELDRLNDTIKINLQVKGIPGYSIGADKAVTSSELAAGVLLDAGLNGVALYNSYLWSAEPSLLPLTPPTGNRTITVNQFGIYFVTVTNENSCTAVDTVKVIEATSDVTITAVSGLSDACQYPTPIKPQITIKNLGPNLIGPNSVKAKTIPLSIMVDGVEKVSEIFTPSTDIPMNGEVNYTFLNSVDLSLPKAYKVRIYSKISEDPNKTNDTAKITTNVWGLPIVNFPKDTIVTYQADTLTLDAGIGFATYTWQDNTHNQTILGLPLNSAWYKVTVTDFHGCGSAKDSVYVNAKDLSVLDIESPFTAFCSNPIPKVAVRIKNSGRDNFAVGSVVKITYVTPNETVSHNFTLDQALISNETALLAFPNNVNLPIGEGFVEATAEIVNDPIRVNNVFEKSFVKLSNPTVSFNPSILYKVFDATPYTVVPTYSSDVKSFLWQDLTTDSLYTIVGTPPAKTLQVIAFDGQFQVGCTDTASLTIVAEDIYVKAIKSPTNQCVLGSGVPIVVTIGNNGNFSYAAGTSYTIGINVDGVSYLSETKNLATNLDPGGAIDLTLNPVLNLTGKSSSSTQITVSTAVDANTNNNSLNKTVYATGYPSVNLGVDKTIHAWSDTLRAGGIFNLYDWKYNTATIGTDSILVATQTGTYGVTVTDYNGCSASDNIVLTFVVDDIKVESLDKPQTGCGLLDTEPVRVTVKNQGTEIIPSGKQIEIGFSQNGLTKKENFTLLTNLTAGQTRTFDLAGTMDFSEKKTYPIDVWVKMSGDMNVNNDTLITSVDAYPPVLFSFGPDIISETPYTLDAGAGFSGYLWSTSETSQSIMVNTTGSFWVEVTNSYGCKGRDTVNVKIGTRDISLKSLVTPQTSCSLSAAETVTVRIENTGTYNDLAIGTVIQLVLNIGGSDVTTENCTLSSSLVVGDSIDYSFTFKPNLSAIGNHLIVITAQMTDDEVPTNNSVTKNITVYGVPAVDLGLDRTINAPTVLDAGAGYVSYLWQDASTNQTFTATQTGKYFVTVIDANGCSGYDEVNLSWLDVTDVRVNQLISPSTNCFNSLGQTVTAVLTNMGSRTFNSGESINISYQIGTNTPIVETKNLTASFAKDQTLNYTFNQKAMIAPGVVSMFMKTIISGIDGPTAEYPVTVNSNPALNLADTIKIAVSPTAPFLLFTNLSGAEYSYHWSTGSTNPSISVTAYGSYSVIVTYTATSCFSKDTVVIHSPVGVETIPGTNSKVSLFPNPVNDELKIVIETDKAESFTIDFINPQGQLVNTLKTDETTYYSNKINVSSYSPGVYLVKVSNRKGSAVFKVIVDR